MLRGQGARNKTRECQVAHLKATDVRRRPPLPRIGDGALGAPADSRRVNAYGVLAKRWVQVTMLALNLVVWLDAAVRIAG